MKNNKGFTGIDISISIIVIIIFVSIITTLIYNYTLSTRRVERKSAASYIAVQLLEDVKKMNYDEVINGITYDKIDSTLQIEQGYNVTVTVQGYDEISGKTDVQDCIKKVTIKIEYTVGKITENLEISTLITKSEVTP